MLYFRSQALCTINVNFEHLNHIHIVGFDIKSTLIFSYQVSKNMNGHTYVRAIIYQINPKLAFFIEKYREMLSFSIFYFFFATLANFQSRAVLSR